MRNIIEILRGWFSALASGIRATETTIRKAGEWTLNHLYAIIVPVVVALKSSYDFICTSLQRVQAKLATVDIEGVKEAADTSTFSIAEVLAFINSFTPLDELFAWLVFLFNFWAVCMMVRTIKGIKQMVAF